MALSEFEIKRIEKLVGDFVEKRRPAPRIRSKFDIAFQIKDQGFEIYTVRPRWDDPETVIESSVARATYEKSRKMWKIFWMRADLKWYSYGALPVVKRLEEVLQTIDEDSHSCFWG